MTSSHPSDLCLGVGGTLWNHMTDAGLEWMKTSDYRDKTDFLNIESDKALNFINSLQGKTYVYNHRHDYKDENGNFDEVSYLAGTKKHNRRQAGFIAQDTYQSMINIFQDDNYADIVDYSKYDYPDIEEDQYYMAKEALIPFLVEAIKEQQKQIEELKAEIKTMKEL